MAALAPASDLTGLIDHLTDVPGGSTSLALDKSIYAVDPATGVLGQRLVQNTPGGLIQAPLLIA